MQTFDIVNTTCYSTCSLDCSSNVSFYRIHFRFRFQTVSFNCSRVNSPLFSVTETHSKPKILTFRSLTQYCWEYFLFCCTNDILFFCSIPPPRRCLIAFFLSAILFNFTRAFAISLDTVFNYK